MEAESNEDNFSNNVSVISRSLPTSTTIENGIDNVVQSVAAGKESRETFVSIGLNSEPSAPWTVVEREKLLTGLRE